MNSVDVPQKQVQIAIVGMTGAGKTVLVSTLAMKMSQMADKGVFLAPVGKNRRQTLQYVQQNWATLNSGHWPPSTPAGELIHLQWELSTFNNLASVRFADCAGQDIRALFSQDRFDVSQLSSDLQDLYRYFQNANIVLFLVNMEDILGYSSETSTYNVLNLDQMISVLTQPVAFPRRCAVVLSQYDKYKPEVDQIYNGDLLEYLRNNLPLLHGEYVLKKSFEIIPVAAVEQTQNIIEDGQAKQVPAPDFTSYNLQALIEWIANNVDELTPLLPTPQLPVHQMPVPQNPLPTPPFYQQQYPNQPSFPQQNPTPPYYPPYNQNSPFPQTEPYPQNRGCISGCIHAIGWFIVILGLLFFGLVFLIALATSC